jgi:hypothetical protein
MKIPIKQHPEWDIIREYWKHKFGVGYDSYNAVEVIAVDSFIDDQTEHIAWMMAYRAGQQVADLMVEALKSSKVAVISSNEQQSWF